jgi:hypothetical protein
MRKGAACSRAERERIRSQTGRRVQSRWKLVQVKVVCEGAEGKNAGLEIVCSAISYGERSGVMNANVTTVKTARANGDCKMGVCESGGNPYPACHPCQSGRDRSCRTCHSYRGSRVCQNGSKDDHHGIGPCPSPNHGCPVLPIPFGPGRTACRRIVSAATVNAA